MGADKGARATEEPAVAALLQMARDGDGDAFGELARLYQAELRAHCYRMLGSVHDAEDALQQALVQAWRNLPSFAARGSARSWLYAIATNAALDIARHRSRRELPVDFGPATKPGAGLDRPLTDLPWLEPFPDRLLAQDDSLPPEARYEQRESVELAFIVVLQHLPPFQRSVLLLREVVGFSTSEIASQLGKSPPAVNSALQRARAALGSRTTAPSQQPALRLLGDQRIRTIAEQYAAAIEQGDIDTLISMLTKDATWCMPPYPNWFSGHAAITAFLTRYSFTVRWKHLPTRANGQLAVACYLYDNVKDVYVAAVIDVLTLRGNKINAVTSFLAAEGIEPPHFSGVWVAGGEMFGRFGLPSSLP
jgi:RNA polymerase sigma-70 factor, ECF subfamily